jgi:hypothetical protein
MSGRRHPEIDFANIFLIDNIAGHGVLARVWSNQFFDKGREQAFLSGEKGVQKHVFLRNEPDSFHSQNSG